MSVLFGVAAADHQCEAYDALGGRLGPVRPGVPSGSRRSVYAHSREQVVTRLQRERWRLDLGTPVRSRGLLLGDYLLQWLDVARTRLRPRTVEAYELCSRPIDGELGEVPLTRLTPQNRAASMRSRAGLRRSCIQL